MPNQNNSTKTAKRQTGIELLKDLNIRRAKPGTKTKKLNDGAGLYLEISPSGGKWWRFRYRIDGIEKRISLGTYPDIPLILARERRREARQLVAQGIDPSKERKAQALQRVESTQNTFETIAREWFEKQEPNWVESHSSRIISRLEADIFGPIGNEPISQIKAPQVLRAVRSIESRGALETAHRVLANCSQIFRYAVATGRADSDPTRDLRGALPPVKSRHLAATTEPDKVAEILRAIDSYKGTMIVKSALKLAPLVFVRPGELRHAQWADIDFNKAEWRFMAAKTGVAHIVPLAKQAIGILRELQPLTSSGIYVFPSARSRKRAMSDNAVLAALRRMDILTEEMSGHGFRAMARTILDEELHFPAHLIEHQLAHAVRDPHGRAYNRTTHLKERKKMMTAWANYLDKLKAGGDVVPLKRAS